MDISNDFTKTVDILHRAMDASLVRRDVIANNIANADVPNFKRSVVNFESELKRALDSAKNKPALELTLTDPKHIPNWRERDYREVQPRRVLDYVTTAKNNGNNVDPEEEMMVSYRDRTRCRRLSLQEEAPMNLCSDQILHHRVSGSGTEGDIRISGRSAAHGREPDRGIVNEIVDGDGHSGIPGRDDDIDQRTGGG